MLSKVQRRGSYHSLTEPASNPPDQSHPSLSNKSSLISDQGQTTPNFVNSTPKRLICSICTSVLKDAVQSRCGCRFCKECVNSIFLKGDSIKCPGNQIDCGHLRQDEIYRDTSARREIAQLLVYCTFKDQGCSIKCTWKKLSDHEKNCEYRWVSCNYQKYGCTEIVIFNLMKTHTQKCRYKPIVCKYCTEEVAKIKEHQELYCKTIPIQCPYGCQTDKTTREKMEEHKKECLKKPEECPFKSFGCEFTGTNEDILQHSKESTKQHLEYITVLAAKMDLDVVQIKRTLMSVHTEREANKRDLDYIKLQCENLQKDEKELNFQVKDLMMKIVSQIERIKTLERSAEECATKSSVDAQRVEIQQLKESIESFTEIINEIERGQNSSSHFHDYQQTQKQLLDPLRQQDRQIGIHDIRLAELDLRYQILETTSYGGVMIWKIRDYRRRKQDAINGRTLSLYSQPFYSEQFGYKMCGRVYLYGDGIGKGTHLSMYFALMRGEYDALLQWPFRKHVTLALLDQERSGCDIMDSFEPDTSSSSFTRPTREMNIATGCPQFVSHVVLETSKYIKDDTLFLKIQVFD